jgi:hypothetical protein
MLTLHLPARRKGRHGAATRTDRPYRVVPELGRDGMGRVFLAVEGTEQFRRDVAVKVIDRPAGDAEAVRRFRRWRLPPESQATTASRYR